MRQEHALFEPTAFVSAAHPIDAPVRQYQGNGPLLPAAQLNEILRFEENHGPDPP